MLLIMFPMDSSLETKPPVMNFNIDIRKKQLESLNQYITSSKDRVFSILDFLGWKAEHITKNTDKLPCPINRNHNVPLKKLDQHIKTCCVKSAGYQLDEQFLSEPSSSNTSSIVLDNAKKIEILNTARITTPKFRAAWNGIEPDPLTSDRLHVTFSPDERLALYSYAVKNTEPPPAPSEFLINLNGEEEKEENLTKEELLERERNARRRRVKYKSVHTSKSKCYKEVVREVIDNQMKQYEEHIALERQRQQKIEEEASREQQNSQSLDTLHTREANETETDFDRIARVERIEREASKRYKERNGRERDRSSIGRDSYERSRRDNRDKSRRNSHDRSPRGSQDKSRNHDRSRRNSPDRSRRSSLNRSQRDSLDRSRRSSHDRSQRDSLDRSRRDNHDKRRDSRDRSRRDSHDRSDRKNSERSRRNSVERDHVKRGARRH